MYKAGLAAVVLLALVALSVGGGMMRKSIVFNEMTPDVFYCPQEKPTSFDKMYVRAKPLEKLCEFHGRRLPASYKSDCYNDVDESEWACKEKKRIMMRRDNENEETEVIVDGEVEDDNSNAL